jgi:TonB-dependent SusC/RagA subfamily outer membrane receptor
MIAWMLYGALLGTLIAIAATAASSFARLLGLSTRWIWAAALLLAVALPVANPLRRANEPVGRFTVYALPVTAAAPTAPRQALMLELQQAARWSRAVLNDGVRSAAASVGRHTPLRLEITAGVLWAMTTAGLVLLLVAVHRRVRRALHGWPPAELFGTPVVVGGETGPLVAGIVNARIVVPAWLFARSTDEQRAVVAHEAEHVRARDPLLLAGASIVTALLPWNPALWFLRSRLRLAVELDCDARVLRGGTSRNFYGNLLIDVAEQALPVHLDALALAGRPSDLYRRVLAMDTNRSRFSALRGGIALTLAAAALLAACNAEMPTAADIDQMDAARASQAASRLAFVNAADSTTTYTIDGRVVSRGEAEALQTASIAAIEIVKRGRGAGSRMAILTKGKAIGDTIALRALRGRLDSVEREKVAVADIAARGRRDGTMVRDSAGLVIRRRDGTSLTGADAPAIYVDGVLSDATVMRTLDPKNIEKIEVLKGPAAAARYSAPNAANGVIVITTKKGGG